jgi:hypothetical protein
MGWTFRGWDATGQKGWVYGDLAHNKKILKEEPFLEDRIMVGGYEVVPDSVGICPGIKDDFGNVLYDGDICRVTIYGRRIMARLFYFEKQGQFLLGGGGLSFPVSYAQTCVKVGNIFENKDLLKNE